jgi:hypothetical protein
VIVALVYKNISKNRSPNRLRYCILSAVCITPEMTIDPSNNTGNCDHEKGVICDRTLPPKSTYYVNSFIFLAREVFQRHYFHRSSQISLRRPDLRDRYGGPGYTFVNEDSD